MLYRLKDSILEQINKKYGKKVKLFNPFYPIKDNIKYQDLVLGTTIEGQDVAVDIIGNKIVKNGVEINNYSLEPRKK